MPDGEPPPTGITPSEIPFPCCLTEAEGFIRLLPFVLLQAPAPAGLPAQSFSLSLLCQGSMFFSTVG